MTQANLLDLAKQGDPQAIADLMNRSLQPRGMTAAVDVHGNCLEVVLEAAQIPNRQVMCAFVENGIKNLGVTTIETIKVLGQQSGSGSPAWTQEIHMGAALLKTEVAPPPVESIVMPDAPAPVSSLHSTPAPVAPFRPAAAPGELPLAPVDTSSEQAAELDLGLETPERSTASPEASDFDLGLDANLDGPEIATNLPESSGLDLDFDQAMGLSATPEDDLLADLNVTDDEKPIDEPSDLPLGDVASEGATDNLLLGLDEAFGGNQPSDVTGTPTEAPVSIDDWFTDETTTDQTEGESLELDQDLNLGMLDDMDHSSEIAPTLDEMTDLPNDAALVDLLTIPEASEASPADWSLDLLGTESPTEATASALDESFNLSATDTASDVVAEEEWSLGETDTEEAIAPLEDWGLDSLELPAEPTVAAEEDWLAELSDSEPAPAITFDEVNGALGETEQGLPSPPTTDESDWSLDLPAATPVEPAAITEEAWGDLGFSSASESQWEAPVILDDQGETWLLDDAVSPAAETASVSLASEGAASEGTVSEGADETDEWGLDLTPSEDWGLDTSDGMAPASDASAQDWSLEQSEEAIATPTPETDAANWSFDLGDSTSSESSTEAEISTTDWSLGLPEEPSATPEISEEWSLHLTDDVAGGEPPVETETSAADWSLGWMDDSTRSEPSIPSESAAEEWSLDLPQDELPASAPDISEDEWSLDLADNSMGGETANLAATPTAELTLDLPEASPTAPEESEQEGSFDWMDDATAGEMSPAAEPAAEEWTLDLPDDSGDAGRDIEIEALSDGTPDLPEGSIMEPADVPAAGSELEWTLDLPDDTPPATAAPDEEWTLDLAGTTASTPPAAPEDDWTLDLPEEPIAPELAGLAAAGLAASQLGEHGPEATPAQAEEEDWVLDLPDDVPPTASSEVADDWSLAAETDITTSAVGGDDADWSLVDLPSPALVEPSEEGWSLDTEAATNLANDITSPFAPDDWSVAEGQEILHRAGTPTEAEEMPALAFEPESSTAPGATPEADLEPDLDLSLGQEWVGEAENQTEDWSVPSQSSYESPEDLPPDLDSVEEPEQRWLELPDEAIAPVPPAVSHYTLQPQPLVNEERPPLSFASPEANLELGDFDVAPTPAADEADEVEPATLPVGSIERPAETTSRSGGLLYYVVLAGLLSWTMGLIGFSLMSNLSSPTPTPQPTVVPQSSSTNSN
ncbi:MAG TPA: hypothetical protein IGS37_09090 [Synechococcales cyanobacterium M55_K2018_004]|nr:hypothetical protein [Synechococcales cyanobacterium M55_K2018_004]